MLKGMLYKAKCHKNYQTYTAYKAESQQTLLGKWQAKQTKHHMCAHVEAWLKCSLPFSINVPMVLQKRLYVYKAHSSLESPALGASASSSDAAALEPLALNLPLFS